MMKDFNSNSRTLIVSFVLAIMFLVPLRFVELGNQTVLPTVSSQVLGTSVILPNANVEVESVLLEAPYAEIEAGCSKRDGLIKELDNANLTQLEIDKIVTEIDGLDKVCK
jgi:hypothetical protein